MPSLVTDGHLLPRRRLRRGVRGGGSYFLLGAAVCGIGTYYLLPPGGVAQAVLFWLFNVIGMWAAWRAHGRSEGPDVFVWRSVAVALTLAAVANAGYYGFPLLANRPVPFPCPVDILFLATQPCFIIALLGIGRGRRGSDGPGDSLDAAIVVVGGAGLMLGFVIVPVVSNSGMTPLGHIVAIAYPAGDLVVFAALARLVIAGTGSSAAVRFLCAGVASLLAADVLFAIQLEKGTYAFGGPVDGMWMAYYALIGAAALHPRASEVSRPAARTDEGISPLRLIAMCVVVLLGPAVLAMTQRGGSFVIAASSVGFVLVMVRMSRMNRRLMSLSEELRHQATTDHLTGLANRSVFEAELQQDAGHASLGGGDMALLLVDVDDFKTINDTHGHAVGDTVLQEVAARLRETVRSGDVVARLGGDEFALVIRGPEALARATTIAERVLVALALPIPTSACSLTVGVSVGLAAGSAEGDPAGLLQEADSAMYSAKRRGKNCLGRFDGLRLLSAGSKASE